ncbi:AT-hook motif nuclear-localized protein 17 [Linum grandiflorum]
MFSKLHPHQNPLPFPPHHVSPPPPSSDHPNSSDGGAIEVVRRPRGRPPGSKNKPKPPVIITRVDPSEPPMSPYILEIPPGSDLLDSIARFCRRKSIGLCVLSGSGTVANVTLRQPSTNPGATITFHGRFDILSLSATFFPAASSHHLPNSFTISLAGPQGQIVGGIVDGSLMAVGTVFIIGATFNNPSFHRLPSGDVADGRSSGSGGGGEGQASPVASGAGNGGGGGGGESPRDGGGMVYSGNLGNEIIWPRQGSSSRPPPQPPVSGGHEIMWGDITPTSPSAAARQAPGAASSRSPPPRSGGHPGGGAGEMMWPPNGRAAASTARSPSPY